MPALLRSRAETGQDRNGANITPCVQPDKRHMLPMLVKLFAILARIGLANRMQSVALLQLMSLTVAELLQDPAKASATSSQLG